MTHKLTEMMGSSSVLHYLIRFTIIESSSSLGHLKYECIKKYINANDTRNALVHD